MKHYLTLIAHTIIRYPSSVALVDYDSPISYTYRALAEQVAKIHILLEKLGAKKGDKIALCGRNSSNWAVAFLAVETYGAVAVSLLPDFTSDDIYELVAHSDTKILFVGAGVINRVDASKMAGLQALISLVDNFKVLDAKTNKVSWEDVEAAYQAKYPDGLDLNHLDYPTNNLDELALINYTSGTTSSPKGVMLTHRSLSSNVIFGLEHIPNGPSKTTVGILPLAHMFGLMFEFLYQLAGGTRVVFITGNLAPTIMLKAFAKYQPYMILTVPLVIEKIFKKGILPMLSKPLVQVIWRTPIIQDLLRRKIRSKLMKLFGGKLEVLIIGGAPINASVEECMKEVKLPFTIGYGMTECGPLLSYEDWRLFKEHSCGKVVDRMQIKVDSEQPDKVEGELLVKGDNVMIGYYKNEQATQQIFTDDGWMRTGDIGIIDKEGNIFIKGRNKNMILGPSGQNIYPEEIEEKLNDLEGVTESIVLDRKGKIVALVYSEQIAELGMEAVQKTMQANLQVLNKQLPAYSKVSEVEVVEKEFEKTPKRSIKRFLYK